MSAATPRPLSQLQFGALQMIWPVRASPIQWAGSSVCTGPDRNASHAGQDSSPAGSRGDDVTMSNRSTATTVRAGSPTAGRARAGQPLGVGDGCVPAPPPSLVPSPPGSVPPDGAAGDGVGLMTGLTKSVIAS